MTVTWFSQSVHSIVKAQTRLACFAAFIVYMSTISNIHITLAAFSLSAVKVTLTLVSIFMAGLGIQIHVCYNFQSCFKTGTSVTVITQECEEVLENCTSNNNK